MLNWTQLNGKGLLKVRISCIGKVEVKPKPRTYNCPVCGKVYNNANSLWAHKKAKHPGLNQIPSTTKVTAVSPVTAGSPVTAVTPVTAGKTSVTKGGKEYVCPVCSKNILIKDTS